MLTFNRFALYSIGLAIGSEVVWQFCKLWYKRYQEFFEVKEIEKIKPSKERNEVHFTCEKSIPFKCENVQTIDRVHTCSNRFCGMTVLDEIIKLIDDAQFTIDLAIYLFNSFQIADALENARRRGVKVRVISDAGSYSVKTIHDFYCRGLSVRSTRNRLMHHKFCIIDYVENTDKEEKDCEEIVPILIIGSVNWTNQSFYSNNENLLITTDRKLVNEYESQFNYLWKCMEVGGIEI